MSRSKSVSKRVHYLTLHEQQQRLSIANRNEDASTDIAAAEQRYPDLDKILLAIHCLMLRIEARLTTQALLSPQGENRTGEGHVQCKVDSSAEDEACRNEGEQETERDEVYYQERLF